MRTLRDRIINGTRIDIENEVLNHIVENYNHEDYSKTQFIECDLPAVIFQNKYLKEYLDNLLSDSGITYRERGMLLFDCGDYMRISMRIPAHFYSDKPVPKKSKSKVSKKVSETVGTLATAIVTNSDALTTKE